MNDAPLVQVIRAAHFKKHFSLVLYIVYCNRLVSARDRNDRTHLKTKGSRDDSRSNSQIDRPNSTPSDDRPLSVKEASRYLGVSPQTVVSLVERKQIPISA